MQYITQDQAVIAEAMKRAEADRICFGSFQKVS